MQSSRGLTFEASIIELLLIRVVNDFPHALSTSYPEQIFVRSFLLFSEKAATI